MEQDHGLLFLLALRVPARFRRQILVRVDGAGASHDLIIHLLSLASPRRALLFTCGWMITTAGEQAIALLPAGAWKPGITQDGETEEDKDVGEITHLMSRAGNWPGGLRWIARRVKPSRRQARNLAAYEKKTGWRYSITCTSIPLTGIDGVPGSHHPQYIDVVHREHACVEDRRRPHRQGHGPARPPVEGLAGQQPDQHEPPARHGRRQSRRGRSRYAPGHPGNPSPRTNGHEAKNGYQHNQ